MSLDSLSGLGTAGMTRLPYLLLQATKLPRVCALAYARASSLAWASASLSVRGGCCIGKRFNKIDFTVVLTTILIYVLALATGRAAQAPCNSVMVYCRDPRHEEESCGESNELVRGVAGPLVELGRDHLDA